ncbi:MAG: hypothetical protein AAGC47_15320, partial [Bacteroidota bacterium]
MKKLLVLLLLGCSLMLSGQQVLNGGFEDINLNEFNPEDPYPEHWLGWHEIMGFLPCWNIPYTGSISTDSYLGDYCIKMETLECEDQNSTIPGGFFTANPGTGSPYFYSNPFSERPEFLNFYYKFNSVGGDSAWVGIQLLNYDSITPDLSYTERVEIVAYTETYIKESVSDYTEFVLPIEYVTEDFPGFMWIGFRTGDDPQNINYHVGTTLWVDEVTVSGGILNTSDTNFLETSISLFPNPAKDSFQIGTENEVAVQTIVL